MAKGNEEELSKRLLSELRRLLQEYDLKVDDKVKILGDLTCLKSKDGFKLGLGFIETDIAVYKRIPFDKSNRQLKEHFKFIRDSRENRKILNVPFVILELKSGSLTTDAVRARNEVARRIKNVFPFCGYFFIGEETRKQEETMLRQGKDFNNFFVYGSKVPADEIKRIASQFIRPYLNNLRRMNFI